MIVKSSFYFTSEELTQKVGSTHSLSDKVAPIKCMIIPRLELRAALIIAHLLKHASSLLSIPRDSIFAWTDSPVVLVGLHGHSQRFETFVGNRVSEVLELTLPNAWHHASGQLASCVRPIVAPANCGSRGLYPADLADRHPWWQGQNAWFRQPETWWPATDEHSLVYVTSEEQTTNPGLVVLQLMSMQCHALPLLLQILSYSQLIRVTARILKFIFNFRQPQ